jgi:hypothetical protein
MSTHTGIVIDAALRFARSNPELVRYAQDHAGAVGASVDELLIQAIDRVVAIRAAEERAAGVARSGVERPLIATV